MMDYLDIKSLNDALGRFPALSDELKQIDAALDIASRVPGMPQESLADAAVFLERCRRRIEDCSLRATELYLQAGQARRMAS